MLKDFGIALTICFTVLLLPMNTYALWDVIEPYGIYINGGYCMGGGSDSPCYETGNTPENLKIAVANCTRDLQKLYKERYPEIGAQVVTALACKQVNINDERRTAGFVLGMACHVDTTFQEKFRIYDTTTDDGLYNMFYNGGSWNGNVRDFCLCPDGTTDVTDGTGQVIGCKDKPKEEEPPGLNPKTTPSNCE